MFCSIVTERDMFHHPLCEWKDEDMIALGSLSVALRGASMKIELKHGTDLRESWKTEARTMIEHSWNLIYYCPFQLHQRWIPFIIKVNLIWILSSLQQENFRMIQLLTGAAKILSETKDSCKKHTIKFPK